MYCTHCGEEISDGARFCKGCGKSVENTAENSPSAGHAAAQAKSVPPAPVVVVGFGISIAAVICALISMGEFEPYSLDGSAIVGIFFSVPAIIIGGLGLKNLRVRGWAAATLAIGLGTLAVFSVQIIIFISMGVDFYSSRMPYYYNGMGMY